MASERDELNRRRKARQEQQKRRKAAQRRMRVRLAIAAVVLLASVDATDLVADDVGFDVLLRLGL